MHSAQVQDTFAPVLVWQAPHCMLPSAHRSCSPRPALCDLPCAYPSVLQMALLGSRAALTRLKGMAAAGSHTWLRLALISSDKSAAALFDDVSLAGVARGGKQRSASGHSGSTNAQWVATIQAAGGLVRTNIPMKNTILRIALTNKKQVR